MHGQERMYRLSLPERWQMHQSGSSLPVQMYLSGWLLGGELRARARGANVEAQYGSFGGYFGLPSDHSWYVGREEGISHSLTESIKIIIRYYFILQFSSWYLSYTTGEENLILSIPDPMTT